MARKKKAAPVEPAEHMVIASDVLDAVEVRPGSVVEVHPGPVEPGEFVIGEGTAADVIIEAGSNAGAEMEIKQAAMWLTKWRNKHA